MRVRVSEIILLTMMAVVKRIFVCNINTNTHFIHAISITQLMFDVLYIIYSFARPFFVEYICTCLLYFTIVHFYLFIAWIIDKWRRQREKKLQHHLYHEKLSYINFAKLWNVNDRQCRKYYDVFSRCVWSTL